MRIDKLTCTSSDQLCTAYCTSARPPRQSISSRLRQCIYVIDSSATYRHAYKNTISVSSGSAELSQSIRVPENLTGVEMPRNPTKTAAEMDSAASEATKGAVVGAAKVCAPVRLSVGSLFCVQ